MRPRLRVHADQERLPEVHAILTGDRHRSTHNLPPRPRGGQGEKTPEQFIPVKVGGQRTVGISLVTFQPDLRRRRMEQPVTGRVWQLVRSGDIFAARAGVEKKVLDRRSQAKPPSPKRRDGDVISGSPELQQPHGLGLLLEFGGFAASPPLRSTAAVFAGSHPCPARRRNDRHSPPGLRIIDIHWREAASAKPPDENKGLVGSCRRDYWVCAPAPSHEFPVRHEPRLSNG